jgi:hypothetical protein
MSKKLISNKMFIKAHYDISKLMNSIRELAKIEYGNENYGECVKRSIQWLKFYVALLPKYSDKSNEKMVEEPLENEKYCERYFYILNAISTENYDNVLTKYMDCNKFLVGPKVYQLVQKANSFLSQSNQWDVFMTFSDMVELDKGLTQSDARHDKLTECGQHLDKVKAYSYALLQPYETFLYKIHFHVKPTKTIIASEQSNKPKMPTEYDIVNSTVNNDYYDWTEIANSDWAQDLPEQWTEKNQKSSNNSSIRLTPENAKIDQIISYQTKKSVEYGRIIQIKPTYVEIVRLAKNTEGSFYIHPKTVCKASNNKPAYTRVITIIEE